MPAVRHAKPRILGGFPSTGHVVIEASAGTGKTYTLEHLVIDLLLEHDATIAQILVVTFTEKATAELRLRLRLKLEELVAIARSGNDVGEDGPAWLLDDAAQAKLTAALHALDTATISTIHSFCQRILTEHAFANGRLFSQTQSDGDETFSLAFKETLRSGIAVEETHRRFLQAYLNQGKTVADVEKLLHDLHRERGEHRPKFDHKELLAACDGVADVLESIGDLERALKLGAVSARSVPAVLTRFQRLAPVLSEAASLPAPALLVALDQLREKDDDFAFVLGRIPPGGRLAPLHQAVARLERAAVSVEAALVQQFLPSVRQALARRKSEEGLFDFDDMLALVHATLEGPRGDELAAILRRQYRFALVDEFQDTDDIQWGIFRKAFFKGDSRLFLVGDPKQAIYRFRGADVHTYLRAKAEIEAGGGRSITLDENFRSTGPVIEAYNKVFLGGPGAPFFTGANSDANPVSCGIPELTALGPDGRPAAPVRLLHVLGLGDAPGVDDVREILKHQIAAEIRGLLDPVNPALRFGKEGKAEPLRARDIYCLTYTTREGLELGDVLREWGVPHAFFKQDGLFQTEEALHVKDLLTAVADPQDRENRLRAWITPFFDLTLGELPDVMDLAGTHPLVSSLTWWRALATDRAWARLFADILERSGLVRRELFGSASERALTNYQHVFEVLLEQASRTKGSLHDLVRQLRAWIEERELPPGQDGNTQRLESERDAVQIMTVHKSKGLEAAAVFVLGGFKAGKNRSEFEIFHDPTTESRCALIGKTSDQVINNRIESEAREEQQRLLYVALTRAKARLYLPYFGPAKPGDLPASARPAAFVPNGAYEQVNTQLVRLANDPAFSELSDRVVLTRAPSPGRADGTSEALWNPPPELLAPPARTRSLDGLRTRHAGFVVTSYSRLAAARASAEEPEVAHDAPLLPPAPDDLRGGSAIGTMLHELLEEAPLALTAATPDPKTWREHPEVKPRLDLTFARYALEQEFREKAADLAHTALVAPVLLPQGILLPGIARADRIIRELEFLYPIPERSHPRLGEVASREGWRIERGFVKGFVDLVFEYRGKVYFGDWKSDRLGDFSPAALEHHVESHYDLQMTLYTLALVKLLGIADEAAYESRFGGLLYLFLRAMRPDGTGIEGIHATRPSWARVREFEYSLAIGDLAPARRRKEVA